MHPGIPIQEFVDQYIDAITPRLRSYKQKRWHLQRFAAYFSGRKLASIRRRDLIEYIEHRQNRGVDPSSINVELMVFSASINYANNRWEIGVINPVGGLFFPAKPGRLRYLEQDEAAKLIVEAGKIKTHYLADFIELALNTGARKNELLQLQFRGIDFNRRILTIEGHTTKTGKRRYLPINRAAMDVLERRKIYRDKNCPGSPWVFARQSGERVRFLDAFFRQAVKQAELSDFHIHDLRHTFASWLVSEGVELIKVRDLLGHASIRMTERYAHLAPRRLHEAVEVLDRYRSR
ncbi:MAG: site-specific integrase [Candidatus Accumulibacter sp.]|jgi:site-specific recombinase XerD|nr:site-specific integrase [Accumulibacter sp.]